jgi:hypothetical protein
VRLTATDGWIALGVVCAVYELGTWATGHVTLSQLVWRISEGREWVRWVGAAGLLALWWHFWGPES